MKPAHHLPTWVTVEHHAIEFFEDTRLTLVEQRLNGEIGSHYNPQLIGSVRLLGCRQFKFRRALLMISLVAGTRFLPAPAVPFTPRLTSNPCPHQLDYRANHRANQKYRNQQMWLHDQGNDFVRHRRSVGPNRGKNA